MTATKIEITNGKSTYKGKRISSRTAQKFVETSTTAPGNTGCAFDKLNAATQAFFFELCEQIMSATKDTGMTIGACIGKDLPSIGLANAPRLTNLKKAGMIEKGGKGYIQLTELGRAIFLAQV